MVDVGWPCLEHRRTMGDEHWYRGAAWDKVARAEFEERLSRARSQRPQYMRIKATHLLDSDDPVARAGGVDLMRRLIDEYPDDRLSVPFAHEQLAMYFEKQGLREEAKNEYRQSIAKALPNRSGTRWPDLSLVELLIDDGEVEEALERWEIARTMSRGQDVFPAVAFDFHRIEAKVSLTIGDQQAAEAAAQKALAAAAATQSNALHHRNLGLVESDEATLAFLRRTARRT